MGLVADAPAFFGNQSMDVSRITGPGGAGVYDNAAGGAPGAHIEGESGQSKSNSCVWYNHGNRAAAVNVTQLGSLGSPQVQMGQAGNHLRVVAANPGGPGRRAGLCPGDRIVQVEGVGVMIKSYDHMVTFLSGMIGLCRSQRVQMTVVSDVCWAGLDGVTMGPVTELKHRKQVFIDEQASMSFDVTTCGLGGAITDSAVDWNAGLQELEAGLQEQGMPWGEVHADTGGPEAKKSCPRHTRYTRGVGMQIVYVGRRGVVPLHWYTSSVADVVTKTGMAVDVALEFLTGCVHAPDQSRNAPLGARTRSMAAADAAGVECGVVQTAEMCSEGPTSTPPVSAATTGREQQRAAQFCVLKSVNPLPMMSPNSKRIAEKHLPAYVNLSKTLKVFDKNIKTCFLARVRDSGVRHETPQARAKAMAKWLMAPAQSGKYFLAAMLGTDGSGSHCTYIDTKQQPPIIVDTHFTDPGDKRTGELPLSPASLRRLGIAGFLDVYEVRPKAHSEKTKRKRNKLELGEKA